MSKFCKTFFLSIVILSLASGAALATPSTQIWIPSTDIQPYGTFHLDIDDYIRVKKTMGSYSPIIYDAGVTAGVLPFQKIQAEVGFDYIRYGAQANGTGGTSSAIDDSPIYFNAKIATPEDAFFKWQPAIAFGCYNAGLRGGDVFHNTEQDITYALVARTLPVVGRLSGGYYFANGGNLFFKDNNIQSNGIGRTQNNGVLASWDRTITEISDKLWFGVDYQGGNNAFGALSFGGSWNFSKNVSVLVGYDVYNRKATGGQPTFTTQLDINYP
ncbi:MAG: hypothetical protein ABSG42_05675 [Nitrospirota bacterium]